MLLVGFGDCWEAHLLPFLLPEHIADEVILVQPLHDNDDGPSAFVVEPAVEGVVEGLLKGPVHCRGDLPAATAPSSPPPTPAPWSHPEGPRAAVVEFNDVFARYGRVYRRS